MSFVTTKNKFHETNQTFRWFLVRIYAARCCVAIVLQYLLARLMKANQPENARMDSGVGVFAGAGCWNMVNHQIR